MSISIKNREPKIRSVLIIALRQFGDVVFTLPAIALARDQLPEAKIDVLVYSGSRGLFNYIDYVDDVIETPNRPQFKDYAKLLSKVFQRYDLCFVTQHADRPHIYGVLAATQRFGILSRSDPSSWWKKFFLKKFIFHFSDDATHAVSDRVRLVLTALGGSVKPLRSGTKILLTPQIWTRPRPDAFDFLPEPFKCHSAPTAVIHPATYRLYKDLPTPMWLSVIQSMRDRGFKVLLTGGPATKDHEVCVHLKSQFLDDPLVINAAGLTNIAQTIALLAQAYIYWGVDTVVSHIAASLGVRSVVFFGPSDPAKYGSVPSGLWVDSQESRGAIWNKRGAAIRFGGTSVLKQTRGNVTIFQSDMACVPCARGGCLNSVTSHSDCLQSDQSTLRAAWSEIIGSVINV